MADMWTRFMIGVTLSLALACTPALSLAQTTAPAPDPTPGAPVPAPPAPGAPATDRTTTPPAPAAPATDRTAAPAEQLADLKKSIDEMRNELQTVKKDINSLKETLQKDTETKISLLKKDIDGLRRQLLDSGKDPVEATLSAQRMRADIENIQKQISDLRVLMTDPGKPIAGVSNPGSAPVNGGKVAGSAKETDPCRKNFEQVQSQLTDLSNEVRALRTEIGAGRRTTTTEALYPVSQLGRIRFVNDYAQSMTVRVNQDSYTLRPRETRDVDVPAGSFTVQVFGVHDAPVVRNVQANKTYRFRVFERFGDSF